MNSLSDTEAISCTKKYLLLLYFEESIHKAINNCDPKLMNFFKKNCFVFKTRMKCISQKLDYFISVNLSRLTSTSVKFSPSLHVLLPPCDTP